MISNLRELLGRTLGKAGLQTTSDVWQLAEIWSATLGAQIASRAAPVRLVRGELVIAVPEAVWRQELSLLAPQILARLNQALGREAVQRIRLIGGEAAPPESSVDRDRPRRRLPRVSSAVPENAAARAPTVAAQAEVTGELAAALRSLAAKRAERIVADDPPQPPRTPPSTQAPPRSRW